MRFRNIASLVALAAVTTASASTPVVVSHVQPDSVGIGDRFTYSIEVERDIAQVALFPEFQSTPQIEVVESAKPDTLWRKGRKLRLRKQYTMQVFEQGRINMGRGKVLYADKNITDTLYGGDTVFVNVGTFQIDTAKMSIADLKPQEQTPFVFAEIRGYVVWSLVALLIVALAVWGILWWLKRSGRNLGNIFKTVPPVPEHIEAIEALEKLRNQRLYEAGRHKLYWSTLTDILRRYLERRYSVHAMEMTSDEILRAMVSLSLSSKNIADMRSILQSADLVKFAKATPTNSECSDALDEIYYFVEQTKREEEPTQNPKK